MLKILALTSLSLILLLSCDQTSMKQEEKEVHTVSSIKKVDSVSYINKTNYSYDSTSFDYTNMRLSNGYRDSAFAKFSSEITEDRFLLSIPKGLITETKTTIRVTTVKGEVIYEHIFTTSDLVSGYATAEIKSDSEMEKYLLSKAKLLLNEGLMDSKELSEDDYLNQALKEDFENYDVFIQIKNANKCMFHYCLHEESHYFLGYSDKLKKVVKIINCC